ncbi:hypothetical protein ACH3XW_42815 [Acanthocheilonema viteae]
MTANSISGVLRTCLQLSVQMSRHISTQPNRHCETVETFVLETKSRVLNTMMNGNHSQANLTFSNSIYIFSMAPTNNSHLPVTAGSLVNPVLRFIFGRFESSSLLLVVKQSS